MEFWIVILVVGAIIFFSNVKSKNAPQRTQNSDSSDWQDIPDKNKLLSLLKNISGFKANKIIESKAGFYVFGIDEMTRKVAFVTTDLAITIIKYEDILSYSIRKIENKNYAQGAIAPETKIFLDIRRHHFNKPSVNIECFNAQKLMNRVINPIKNQLMLKAVYTDELTQVGLIGNILSDIIKKSVQTPPPAPTSTQKSIIVDNPPKIKQEAKPNTTTIDISKEITSVKNESETENLHEVDNTINVTDILASINTAKIEDIIPVTPIEEMTDKMEIPVDEIIIPKESIDGKIKISISEIESLTKGTFLDNELFSAMNEARVKGEKDIYISEEQFESLQQNDKDNIGNNYTKSDLSYKPISYNSEYKEDILEEKSEM